MLHLVILLSLNWNEVKKKTYICPPVGASANPPAAGLNWNATIRIVVHMSYLQKKNMKATS